MKVLDKLQTVMNETWGKDIHVTKALYLFCNKNYNLCKKIMKEDLIYNLYTNVSSWTELAKAIINDECFSSIIYQDYLDPIISVANNEYEAMNLLFKDGWRLDEDNNVAILFDIKNLKNYEI